MTLHTLRHSAWLALVASSALVACSKTPATEEAYVSAQAGNDPTSSDSTSALDCSIGALVSFLQVGSLMPGQAGPQTIPDGQGGLTVDCSVTPSGGGYDLQLDAAYHNVGDELIVTGHVDGTSGGTVFASFVSNEWMAFSDGACTLDYSNATGGMQHISAGNIAAHITCPNLINSSGVSVTLPGGKSVPETCYGTADIVFQNCAGGS